jgi:[ribosomal protein S18]-alanine N-acetyltransferase
MEALKRMITIRKMKEKDLEVVAVMEKQIFPDPWSYDAFRSDLNNEMAWPLVAVIDDIVVGYACLYIVAGEVQIGNFAVSTDYRKQGIAKVMMNEIIKITQDRKCDSIFLEVRESNVPAQNLYSSFGFNSVGRRVGYYRNPRENAIIMAKEF